GRGGGKRADSRATYGYGLRRGARVPVQPPSAVRAVGGVVRCSHGGGGEPGRAGPPTAGGGLSVGGIPRAQSARVRVLLPVRLVAGPPYDVCACPLSSVGRASPW